MCSIEIAKSFMSSGFMCGVVDERLPYVVHTVSGVGLTSEKLID